MCVTGSHAEQKQAGLARLHAAGASIDQVHHARVVGGVGRLQPLDLLAQLTAHGSQHLRYISCSAPC